MLPIFHIARLRVRTDGKGITTLVGLSGCPNQCRYCINFPWFEKKTKNISAMELYNLVAVDDIYFQATGGGVTFGGGEPLLWPDGIKEFAQLVQGKWRINIETSLNVPWENIEKIISYTDTFMVDIKDMNEDIYFAYTGHTGARVRENLVKLSKISPEKIAVRIPLIPGFNAYEYIARSKAAIEQMGISKIDVFSYREYNAAWNK